MQVLDQKTGCDLGSKKIALVRLLGLPNMELSHPLSLKNSGPDSKLTVTIRLRVSSTVVSIDWTTNRPFFLKDNATGYTSTTSTRKSDG